MKFLNGQLQLDSSLTGTTALFTSGVTINGLTLLKGSGTTSGTTAVLIQSSTGGTGSVISNTGNYGINVDIPLANFHSRGLYNELYFQSPTTNSGRHDISFGFGSTGRQVRLIASAAGASGNGNLYIAAASGDAGVATTSDANVLFATAGTTFYKTFNIDQSTASSGFGITLSGNQNNSSPNGFFFRFSETRVAILIKPHGAGGYADFRIAVVPVGGANNPPQESDTKFMITKDTTNVLINTTTDLGFKLSVSGSTLLRGSGTTSASYALATQNSSGGTTVIVNDAGNMLIGTTTDAGYRLDVNGTARIQGDSIIWGGGFGYLLRQSGAITYGSTHATVGIQGASSWVLGNDTGVIGSSNGIIDYTTSLTANVEQTSSLKARRMIYGSGEGRYVIQAMDNAPSYNSIGNMYIAGGRNTNGGAHGNVYLGVDLTGQLGGVFVGTKIDNKSLFIVGGTVSGATLSTTRATHINATLLATGNTTTLIGLDIQPNFNRSSFTGTTALALRVSGGTQIIGSGSTGTTLSVFSVDGSSGRLFDVSDDLSSTLFSVNTIAGLPVIEAFANNAVVMGKYNQNTLVVSGTSVGIGTSSPQAKLDVSGTSIFRTGVTMNGSLTLGNNDITSAWSAYTPTWTTDSTQPTLGDGTLTGYYKLIGKTCFVRVRLTFGSTTSSGTGVFYFNLPFSASSASGVQFPCSILDNGNSWYQATVNGEYGGFTNKTALIGQSSGSNASQGVTGTFPFTFGNSDSIQFAGSYEIT